MQQENRIDVDTSSHHEDDVAPTKPQHEMGSTETEETKPFDGSKSTLGCSDDGSVDSHCTSIINPPWHKGAPSTDYDGTKSVGTAATETRKEYDLSAPTRGVARGSLPDTMINHDEGPLKGKDGDAKQESSADDGGNSKAPQSHIFIFSESNGRIKPSSSIDIQDENTNQSKIVGSLKDDAVHEESKETDLLTTSKPGATTSSVGTRSIARSIGTRSIPSSKHSGALSSEHDTSTSTRPTSNLKNNHLERQIEERVHSGIASASVAASVSTSSTNQARISDMNRRISQKISGASTKNLKTDSPTKRQRLQDMNKRIMEKVNSGRSLQSEASSNMGKVQSMQALNKRIYEKVNSNSTLSTLKSESAESLDKLNKRINEKMNGSKLVNSRGAASRTRSLDELNKRINGKVNSSRTLISESSRTSSSSSRGRTLEDINRRIHGKVRGSNSNRTLKSDSSSSREKSLIDIDRRIDGKLSNLPHMNMRGDIGQKYGSGRSIVTASESESSRERALRDLDKRLSQKMKTNSGILSTSSRASTSNRSYASGRGSRGRQKKRVSWNPSASVNGSVNEDGSVSNSMTQRGFHESSGSLAGSAGGNAWDFFAHQQSDADEETSCSNGKNSGPLPGRRRKNEKVPDHYMTMATEFNAPDYRADSTHLLPTHHEPTQLHYNPDDTQSHRTVKSTVNFSRIWLGIAVATALIVGITIPLVLSKSSKTTISVDDSSPTMAPIVDRRQYFPSFFAALLLVSSREVLLDESTPQSEALRWLAYEDDFHLVPSIDGPHGELFQRYAVLVLHFSQKNWIGYNTWADPEEHECDWGFLECESMEVYHDDPIKNWSTSHTASSGPPRIVTGIKFRNAGMEGALASEIGLLTHLRSLNIARNKISEPLPDTIYTLTNLEELWIEENTIGGHIDPRIENLTKLTKLSVHDCKLVGTIPAALKQLGNLEMLYTHDNELEGNILDIITSLPNLAETNNGRNRYSGTLPRTLGSLKKLEYLDASYNDYVGVIPPEVGQLTNLRYLSLQYNRLEGEMPFQIGNMKNLEGIRLNNNVIVGEIPASFGKLTKLRFLNLSHNYISGEVPSDLSSLSDLIQLALLDNQISGMIPEDFRKLINLEQLYIQDNQLGGPISDSSSLCELRDGKLKILEADCQSTCSCCTKCH